MPRTPIWAAGLLAAFMAGEAAAQSPTQVGTFRNWTAYTNTDKGAKQCYIVAQPSDMAPKGVNRDPVYFLVTARPSENVKNEPSVIIGYPFKEDSRVSIEIGQQKFSLFTKEDGAWMDTAAQEDELIAAMRKGSSMVIKGTSRRGTNTTDTYQLGGVSAALDKMAESCK